MDDIEKIYVSIEYEELRLDQFLAEYFNEYSRSHFQKLIKGKNVLVNGVEEKASYKVSVDDEITVKNIKPKEIDIVPEDIPLDILYEDSDVLIVNKPKGMVVHPAPGHQSGTLVNAIMFHCKDDLSGINGEIRPGIVHRIDRDTTGSLIICKNDYSHNFIAEQIKEHSANRIYRGIVVGNLTDDGLVDAPIGRDEKERKKMAINKVHGKEAVTHYRVLKNYDGYTYVEFKLETGRTHQIRVHMASIGHPLLGDEVYGKKSSKFKLEGQTLHAMKIGFIHPTTKEYMEFDAPLPEYFSHLLDIL